MTSLKDCFDRFFLQMKSGLIWRLKAQQVCLLLRNLKELFICAGTHCPPYLSSQGRLKIWTEHSHWFLLTLKPLEILWQNFQHFYNLKRYEFWPNLKGVAQKLDPPRPFEVFYIFGGKSKFWAPMTLIFSAKQVFM